MATYDKMTSLKNPGRSVQVESAIRDGSGKNIENNYAKQNGYYSTLKAGNADLADFADNLTPYGPNSGVEDDTPFIFQTSGGKSDIGASAQIKKLEGASKPWNQLVINGNCENTSPLNIATVRPTFTCAVGDNVATFTRTSSAVTDAYVGRFEAISTLITAGHKYLVCYYAKKSSSADVTLQMFPAYYGIGGYHAITSDWKFYADISGTFNSSSSDKTVYILGTAISNMAEGDTISIKKLMYFDLTLIYGAGNEPTTVEQFQKDFPLDYYAYDAGSIVSSKVKEYKVVGYNAFNKNDTSIRYNAIYVSSTGDLGVGGTNYSVVIPIISGQKYTIERTSKTSTRFRASSCRKIPTGSISATNQYSWAKDDDAYSIQIIAGEKDNYLVVNLDTTESTFLQQLENLCIHLTWDESKTGYEPYWSETYQFPNVELRGVNDIKDELLPDGMVTRRIGSYTITGNEGIITQTVGNITVFRLNFPSSVSSIIKPASGEYTIANILMPNYSANRWGSMTQDMSFGMYTNGSFIRFRNDSCNGDVATFKTKITGQVMYFELATPTTEQVDPYTENTLIDDWGTQEWLSDNVVMLPQPAEFFYSVDYKAFIDSVGNREDIAYAAGNIVSQKQLTEVVNGTRPVNLADVAVDIYSDREVEDADQACPPAVFSSIGGDAEIQDGNNAFEELRGNSVASNQIVKNGNFADNAGFSENSGAGDFSTISIANNVLTQTFNSTPDATYKSGFVTNYGYRPDIIKDHYYLIKFKFKASKNCSVQAYTAGTGYFASKSVVANTWTYYGAIKQATSTELATNLASNITDATILGNSDTLEWTEFQLFDLTQMFGAGNEPETVAEFNALFPKSYYDYNAGTLLSSKSTGLIIRGMNQLKSSPVKNTAVVSFDRQTFTRLIPGEEYILSFESIANASTYRWCMSFYDIDGNQINDIDLFTFEHASYFNSSGLCLTSNNLSISIKTMKFTAKVSCYVYINFGLGDVSSSTTMSNAMFRLYYNTDNLPYEPYKEETIALPNIELRSAGEAYDVAYSSGGGKRRIGIVDLGTLTWSKKSNNRFASGNELQNIIKTWTDYNGVPNLRCGKYSLTTPANIEGSSPNDKSITISGNGISVVIYDSAYASGDANAFKTAMSGVYLYYELAEETDITTTENPGWQQLININNYGTFEFTSEQTIQVPQAYFVRYTANLVEFLDSAYEVTDGDASKIALKSDVSTEETARTNYDTILQNAIGGTLRQLLASSQSVDFNNTDWVDLGSLTWSASSENRYYATYTNLVIPADNDTKANILCSKYATQTANYRELHKTENQIYMNTGGRILYIVDTGTYADATAFKNAMKGVLLAYEKAS